MPKRTNAFQQLVLRIYEQLVPQGARVVESAMLKERTSDAEREVDILIESTLAGVPIRMAVECRDRRRAADVEWIDQLVGRYRDLPIDRVVAVSNSGFSRAASKKASAHRIDLRTLRAALDMDWPSELHRIGMGLVTLSVKMVSIRVATDPPWESANPPRGVILPNGEERSFEALREHIQRGVTPLVSDYFFKNIARDRPVSELNGTVDQEVHLEAEGILLVDDAGKKHALKEMTIRVITASRLENVPVERQLFDTVGVTTGTFDIPEWGRVLHVTAVQPGRELGKPLVAEAKEKGKGRCP